MRRSLVYHVRSRQLYEAIGKAHLRNRRVHELDYIKTRLLALDFILANPEDSYFETAEEKRRYLIERFKLSESLFCPSNKHGKGIMFSEGFPLCVAYPSPDYMPVVTFTYVDPEHRNLDRYIAHLRTYRPLFRQLPSFQFIYVSTAAGLQNEAAELFFVPCGSQGPLGFGSLLRCPNQVGKPEIRATHRGRPDLSARDGEAFQRGDIRHPLPSVETKPVAE